MRCDLCKEEKIIHNIFTYQEIKTYVCGDCFDRIEQRLLSAQNDLLIRFKVFDWEFRSAQFEKKTNELLRQGSTQKSD